MPQMLILPFWPVSDAAGNPVDAKVWLTAEGTNTPVNAFADAGLSTPLANPLHSDAASKFPTAYLDPDIDYRVRVYLETDTLGVDTPIEEYDPYGQAADIAGPQREVLFADRVYYVRTDGNDSNDGLSNSALGAFATVQHAIDFVHGNIDFGGYKVTVQVANGTYTTPISAMGQMFGARDGAARPLQVIGNETTPANVILNVTGGNSIEAFDHAYILIAGFTVRNTGGIGAYAGSYATIEHRNCVWGPTTNDRFIGAYHATIRAIGPVNITGNGTVLVHATKRSIVEFSGQTVTFTGTPTFSTFLWGVNDSSLNLDSATFVGTARGPITCHENGNINASSVTGDWTGGALPSVVSGGYISVEDLDQSRTFYVRPDGNDGNDGRANSAARAFATIQGAINALARRYYDPLMWPGTGGDPAVNRITLQLAGASTPATFAETVTLTNLPYAACIIKGDEATPANVVVNGTSDGFIAAGTDTKWFIRGIKVTAAAGNCLKADQGGQIAFKNVEFGAAALAHLMATRNGRIINEGNYKISAGAAQHARGFHGGNLDISGGFTVTLTGTPAFSGAFASAEFGSHIRAEGITYSGAATGARYLANLNGTIYTNGGGATYFPGNAAGSTATGGQYN